MTENTPSEAMAIWEAAYSAAMLAGIDDEAGAAVIADTLAERDAEIARLREALLAADERGNKLQDGWVLVPEEPTWEMLEAARDGVILSPSMDAMMKRGLRANRNAPRSTRERQGMTRNCDLISGMDYLETCRMCDGEGEYNQTYTAGCGGGYFTMKGPCDHCAGTGIRTINGGKVSRSHLAQIETRRAALGSAKV